MRSPTVVQNFIGSVFCSFACDTLAITISVLATCPLSGRGLIKGQPVAVFLVVAVFVKNNLIPACLLIGGFNVLGAI